MKKRYKIRKEQLERVVENFVMEESMNMTKKQAPEAKKHKMSMGAEADYEDDMGEGMEMAPEKKDKKKKHAPEAKKHMTKMKESSYNYKDFLSEEELNEDVMETIDAFCEALGLAGNITVAGDTVSKCLAGVLAIGSAGTVGAMMAKDAIKSGFKAFKAGGKELKNVLSKAFKAIKKEKGSKNESMTYMSEDIDVASSIKALVKQEGPKLKKALEKE